MFAVKRDSHTVHKDRANPDRKATRLPVRRYVGDVDGIEYYNVRKGAGAYQAAIRRWNFAAGIPVILWIAVARSSTWWSRT